MVLFYQNKEDAGTTQRGLCVERKPRKYRETFQFSHALFTKLRILSSLLF